MGADAVGLIVGARHRTEDELSFEAAAGLLQAVPVFVQAVLVTHLITADEILKAHLQVPTPTIQLHDEIPQVEIRRLREQLPRVRLIKAISVTGPSAIEEALAFEDLVDALLLDSRTEDRIGGTGKTHDWTISRTIVVESSKPVILAGGLNPENVGQAIEVVRPYAVDVNSGVDLVNGDKDPDKVGEFVRRARASELVAE
jgi:phosphoribosylanthranilate isomerase